MTKGTTNAIWVFGDLRSPRLLALSFKVLAKAAGLAEKTGGRVVLFLLSPSEDPQLSGAEDAAVVHKGQKFPCMSMERGIFLSPFYIHRFLG